MLVFVGGLIATVLFPAAGVRAVALSSTISVVRGIIHHTKKKSSNGGSVQATGSGTGDEQVLVQWESVKCTLAPSKKMPKEKAILRGVSGVAKPGRVFGILGPSGAGKTTLLNALCGRVPANSKITLTGRVVCNGLSIDDQDMNVAYVTQKDLFFSMLTVEETLQLAARMRLSNNMSAAERDKRIKSLVNQLGLVSTLGTNVGDDKTRGISGGEMKRLALACELISAPKLIVCDEPTSGLDAFQAQRVMEALHALAGVGHTVICSIHQPSSAIFELLDDIMLLAGGRCVYTGPTHAAAEHFAALSHPIPANCNPAEHFLNLISIDYSSEKTVSDTKARIDKFVDVFASKLPKISAAEALVSGSGTELDSRDMAFATGQKPVLGPLGQFTALFRRAWRQATRDKKTNIARFMSSIFSALLFGAIYWKMGRGQTSIQDRLGLLQVCTINTAMSALVKTLNVFPREGVLINRERSRGCYGVLPYFVGKLCAELPVSAFFPLLFSSIVYPMAGLNRGLKRVLSFMGIITLESFTAASYGLAIGALVAETETALAIGPPSFVLQIVFGGIYLTDENVPSWARWIPRVSIIKHTYEALCVNELRGLPFEAKQSYDVTSGDQVLERLSWKESTVAKSCLSQLRVLSFNYLFTFAVLTLKKPRYEKITAKEVASGDSELANAASVESKKLDMAVANGEPARVVSKPIS